MAEPKGGEAVYELPSFLNVLGVDMERHFLGLSLHEWLPIIMSLLVGIFLVVISLVATRNMKKFPHGLQAFMETIVEGLENFFGSVMGPVAPRYVPFLGTLFIYILTMNLWGLIPLMHSPTNKLNTTIALALCVFFHIHITGVKKYGVWGYAKHFADPWWLAPLMVPIHIVGELARPLSLSLRLFGNLMGEDIAIAILVGLTPFILNVVPIPIHLIMVFLAILFSLIQAVVFVMLSAIYIGGAAGALSGDSSH
ncbi:MAG: F0F1 ATP synthase subunit A [Thermodesulfobacteriota bacterium]